MELNKVYNMDALAGLKLLPDASVDLVVTDPPYNLKKDFANDDLPDEEFIAFLTPIFNEMARIIKPKHSVIIFFDAGKKLPLFWKCLLSSNLRFQKSCTLYKPNDCSRPHNRTLRKSEVFYICSSTEELRHDGEGYIHDCLLANHQKKEGWYHPTAKNLKVIRQLIKTHSLPGWLVCDPFMGSGTTAVAAQQLGRRHIGFELNAEFITITEQRMSQRTLLEVTL